MTDPDRAKRWRSRAEELRVQAEATTNVVARRNLMRLAADWERMAHRLEMVERHREPRLGRLTPTAPPSRAKKLPDETTD